jgi:hypothetical protein
VTVGPQQNGVRSVDIRAKDVSTSNILLALRLKDLTYSADLPLTGELKGELGRDGLPTYFRGKVLIGAGTIIDTDTPTYPMAIDSGEMNVEWDSGRHVLVAPFKIISGANRITLLAHLEPPDGNTNDWQLGLSGGTIVLAGIDNSPPLIFNRINIGFRFDTERKQVVLAQADISNGEVGVAGTGSIDYSGEPLLKLGFAGTPMSASALKRIWPALIVPEVREWVIERIEGGTLQRIEIGVNTLVKNLPRKGPPIPDDGLSVNIVGNGVTVRPVDGLPPVHDADLKAHVTGRSATVTIRPQADHLRLLVRSAGHASEAAAVAGEAEDRRPGAGGGRDHGVRSPQRCHGNPDRSQHQQGVILRDHQSRHAGQGRADQGKHHLRGHRRPQRICRRQAGDEPEARGQCPEDRRQQPGLSGQGRREDQRAGGFAGLSQARGRRCRCAPCGHA